MVAIFVGQGAGFTRGSANLLGGAGLLGSGSLGRAGENISVNAATGNVLITQQDEFLVGRGLDIGISRTYNSLAQMSDGDNGDKWQQSTTQRVFGLTGTLNTTGSTISRLGGDGSVIVYSYATIGGTAAYWTTDGDGAHDKLVKSGATWVWTDGSSQVVETYEATVANPTTDFRIKERKDTDNLKLTFAYVDTTDKIERVTTSNHGLANAATGTEQSYVDYIWDTINPDNLASIVTGYTDFGDPLNAGDDANRTATRTSYTYESYVDGTVTKYRLKTVSVDLTPENTGDSSSFVTTYSYNATNCVTRIQTTDGVDFNIDYNGAGKVWRLYEVLAGGNRVTTLTYEADYTAITYDGQVTELHYDASQRLTKVKMPTAEDVEFFYDADSNVERVRDTANEDTVYTHDANGNILTVSDPNGNGVTRTYGSKNELLTETRTIDEAGSPVDLVTRYAYDAKNHLRYVVSPQGRVTEYRYTAYGELSYVVEFPEHSYTAPGVPSETALNNWKTNLGDLSSIAQVNRTYDTRGNLVQTNHYGIAMTDGLVSQAEGFNRTYTRYDQAGRLLSRALYNETAETFVYDGLGRLIASNNPASGATTIYFEDALLRTTVTTWTGHTTTGHTTVSTYSKSGELLSVTTSANTDSFDMAGTTAYKYDKLGRVRMITTPRGVETPTGSDYNSFILYDNAGRRTADIAADGSVVEYRYDAAGRLAATIAYTTKLTAPQMGSLASTGGITTIASWRPAADVEDVWSWNVYDDAGRLIQTIAGDGQVTAYSYDDADRLIKTVAYVTEVAIAALKTTLPTAPVSTTSVPDSDRVSRFFYDRDGLLVATLDGEGYLAESRYDEAGRKVKDVAYGTQTNVDLRASGSLDDLRSSTSPSATTDRAMHYVYDGQGLLRFQVDHLGYVTGFEHSLTGRARSTATIVYATSLGTAITDFTYDNIDALTTPLASHADNRESYAIYNVKGQIVYSIDAAGLVTGFTYDITGRVTKTVQYAVLRSTPSLPSLAVMDTWALGQSLANGRVTYNYYSEGGSLRFTVDAEGYASRFDYDRDGNLIAEIRFETAISVTDASTIVDVNALATGNSITVSHLYDMAGRRYATIDGENFQTRRVWDGAGNLVTLYEAYGSTDQVQTDYAYDAAGRLISETRAPGQPEASIIEYGYDGLGNRITVTVIVTDDNDNSNDKTTYNYYDDIGRLIAVRDPASHVTRMSYNAFGEVVSATRFANTTASLVSVLPVVTPDAAKDVVAYSFYDRLGRLTYTVDGEKYVTRSYYNGFGDVVKTVRYATTFNATAATTIADLDTAFGIETATPPASATVASYAYDKRGQVLTVTEAVASGASLVTTSTYDAFGQLKTVTRDVATTSFDYDKRGLVKKTTDAELFFESYTYDAYGNRVSVTAKSKDINKVAGGTTVYTYDKRGLLLTETLPIAAYLANGTEQAATITNKYSYDGRGNRKQLIEGFGLSEARTTGFTYDKLDRLIKTTHQSFQGLTPEEEIAYDAAGNVIRTIDAADSRTVYFYDGLGRKRVSINMAGTYSSFTYDANGNLTETRVYESQLASIPATGGALGDAPAAPTVPTGAYRISTFTYDRLGRLKTSVVPNIVTGSWNGTTWSSSPASLTTAYVYDANGNVIKATDANGNVTRNWYDLLGRKTAQVDAANYLTKWTYDAEGNVLIEKRYSLAITAPADGDPEPAPPGGDTAIRETRFTYDKNGNRRSEERRDVAIHNDASPGTATTVHAKIEWLYNGLGQVVRKIEATGDNLKTVGQLGDESTYYTYDAGGRLKKEQRATFLSHQNSDVTPTVEYFYNGLGDLAGTLAAGVSGDVAARATTYSYSGGKLIQMTDAAGFVRNYKYDVMGRVTHDYYTRIGSSGSAANAYEGTLTQYDVLGRVVKQWQATSINATSWTAATPVVSTLYNAFGEVTKTGVNAANVADGSRVWQTESKYDAAGRVWATNAGDGVWKYFVYDKNGNQTLTITSAGEDLTNKTLDQAIALIGETDVNATYTRYDARNLAWATYEEDRQLGLGNVQSLGSQRLYNAFGETLTETNALGATISYTYNNMGRVTRREGPTVQIKLEDGTTRWVKPSEDFYYDRSGRLVAKLDANGTYAAGGTEAAGTSKAPNTGNLTRLTLLAGTGYDGGQALVTQEIHADDGIKTSRYDIHGDVRVVLDEISRQSTQSFDAMGRVTQVTHASGLVDNYSYDGLGQLIVHWNNVLGSGNKETTDYDVQGRVVSARAYGGDETTTSYVWDAVIGASGMGITPGGWVITTSTVADRASGSDTIFAIVEKTDLFDRTIDRVDAGGQDFDYGFDLVGRLLSEESKTYQGYALRHKAYTYLNTGRIETIGSGDVAVANTDWERNRTTYAYDVMGNQTYEKLERLWGDYTERHQIWLAPGEPEWVEESYYTGADQIRFGTAHYDLLGRMDNYVDNAVSDSANVDKDWFYDANGNVRHINTAYRAMQANGTLATAQSNVDYYYLYDSMNRVVRSKGALSSGAIGRGTVGTDMTYDDAGQRMTAQTGSGAQESYTYNNAGLVTDVTINSITRATTTFDTLGRITGQAERDASNTVVYNRYDIVYDARNQIIAEKSSTKEGSDWIYAHMVNHYSADGTGSVGVITSSAAQGTSTGSVLFHSETKYWKNGSFPPVYGAPGSYSSADLAYADSYSTYTYAWADGPLQQYVTLINRDGTTQSQYTYNREYQLTQVKLTGGARPRTITYANNAGGQILSRREADGNSSLNDPSSRSYFFAGKQMGEVTNNGNENIDYATWIANRTNVDGSGPFQEGSNTASTFADFDQNYVAMNGGTQDSTPGAYRVRSGDTLQMIAAQLWGDASLWYKIAEANGLSGSEALIEGRSLTIPSGLNNIHHNADTFKAYDPAKAVGDVNPNTPKPPKKKGCGVFGQILLAVVAIAVTAATYGSLGGAALSGWSAVGAGALAGAAGSVASQAVGVATGIQSKFSFKAVGLAALGGAISAGLGPKGLFGKSGAFGDIGSKFVGDALRGAVGNALTQGIGVATRLQSKFDFAGVAGAALGAAAGGALGRTIDGKSLFGQTVNKGDFGYTLATAAAGGIANAATRSAINGNSFGDNLIAAIPDIIGQAIGGAIGEPIGEAIAGDPRGDEIVVTGGYDLRGLSAVGGAITANPSAGASMGIEVIVNTTAEKMALAATGSTASIAVGTAVGGKVTGGAESGGQSADSPGLDLTKYNYQYKPPQNREENYRMVAEAIKYTNERTDVSESKKDEIRRTIEQNGSDWDNYLAAAAGVVAATYAAINISFSNGALSIAGTELLSYRGGSLNIVGKELFSYSDGEMSLFGQDIFAVGGGRFNLGGEGGVTIRNDYSVNIGGPDGIDFSKNHVAMGENDYFRVNRESIEVGQDGAFHISSDRVTLSGHDVFVSENAAPRVGSYRELRRELKGTGVQANHLNQDAAFNGIIPKDEGLAVGMRGNAWTEVGSPHYEFHSSLEEFWTPYRKGGNLFGKRPTNAQYGAAVERALVQSGYSPSQAAGVANQAATHRLSYGLTPTMPVPRVPGRLPQVRR